MGFANFEELFKFSFFFHTILECVMNMSNFLILFAKNITDRGLNFRDILHRKVLSFENLFYEQIQK